jgi:hypothetical protein
LGNVIRRFSLCSPQAAFISEAHTVARPEKPLTARTAETLKKPGLHADGGGLYLYVSKSGARSWIFRWKRDGRPRDMGLGALNTVSLAEARSLWRP